MICTNCGKELAEGEICNCTTAQEVASTDNVILGGDTVGSVSTGNVISGGDTVGSVSTDNIVSGGDTTGSVFSSVDNTAASENTEGNVYSAAEDSAATGGAHFADSASKASLPESKDFLNSTKQFASGLAQNPIISEVLDALKLSILNPVKGVAEAAQKTSILWAILAAIEVLITSASIGINVGAGVDNAGTGFKFFGIAILMSILGLALYVSLMMLVLIFYKKEHTFAKVANMVTAAFIPAAAMMAATILLGWISIYLYIMLIIAAVVSSAVLLYLGMQKIDKFLSSPFWIYIAYQAISTLIITVISCKIVVSALGDLLYSSMLY